jgi:hypothetical protein
MNWTDCPVVAVVPGKLSGAPVIAQSRVRPEDLVANRAEGLGWRKTMPCPSLPCAPSWPYLNK